MPVKKSVIFFFKQLSEFNKHVTAVTDIPVTLRGPATEPWKAYGTPGLSLAAEGPAVEVLIACAESVVQ